MTEESMTISDVLAQDVVNIITKAKSGQPLSGRERALLEEYEKEEKVREPTPKSSEAGPARVGRGRNPFEGEERVASKNTGYRYLYVVYAEVYESSERSVKRWISEGRKKEDLPPLDSPLQMKSWWSKNMKHKIPSGLLRASLSSNWDEGAKSVAPQSAELELPAQKPTILTEGDTDDAAALKRLRRSESTAGELMEKAMEESDLPAYEHAQRMYNTAASTRAKYEPVYIKRMQDNKELFTFEQLFEAISELHVPILKSMDALKEDFMKDAHASFTDAQLTYWEEKMNEFRKEITSHFTNLAQNDED